MRFTRRASLPPLPPRLGHPLLPQLAHGLLVSRAMRLCVPSPPCVAGWVGARVANNVHRFTSAEAAGQLRTLRTELAALEAELHTEGLDLLQCAVAPLASAVAVSCGVERVACARGLRACVRISH